MKISRSLNLTTSVELADGTIAHVHSVPIGREVFEQFFMVMSQAFAALFTGGLGAVAGPRVAYLMLKEKATDAGRWDDVQTGLINEIVRLTNVALAGENGWASLPLHTVFERKLIDEDERADVLGELVFFTLVARMNKRDQLAAIMEVVGGLWGSATTVLDFTAFRNSLMTSTEGESSGAMVTTSSAQPSITSPGQGLPTHLPM